jgi:hypothetical protein
VAVKVKILRQVKQTCSSATARKFDVSESSIQDREIERSFSTKCGLWQIFYGQKANFPGIERMFLNI